MARKQRKDADEAEPAGTDGPAGSDNPESPDGSDSSDSPAGLAGPAGLAEAADALYGLPPDRFTAARDERARAAREAGDRPLAEAITALRRPSLSAWANNLLVREHPQQVDALLDLGEGLRRAHRELDGARLRELAAAQRELIGALTQVARAGAARAGHPVSENVGREVADTLRAVLADPAVSRAWATGRLTRAPGPTSGFDVVAPDVLPPRPSKDTGAGAEGTAKSTRPRPAKSTASTGSAASTATTDRKERAGPTGSTRETRERRKLLTGARRELRAAEQAHETRTEEAREARRLAEDADARQSALADRADTLAADLKRTRSDLHTARDEEHAARARARESETRARDSARTLAAARRRVEAVEGGDE